MKLNIPINDENNKIDFLTLTQSRRAGLSHCTVRKCERMICPNQKEVKYVKVEIQGTDMLTFT